MNLQMIQKFFAARNARASQSAVNRSSAIAEVLESRIQLSANEILVNTAVDENDGPGVGTGTSLREAVELANNDANIDTIRFAASLDGVTLFLEGQQYGQMTITQPLSIIGNGPENTVINGQRQSRIFDIPRDVGEVSFEGMTLTKGMTTEDGTTSGAVNYTGGAAIRYADILSRFGVPSPLVVTNCHFIDNRTLGVEAWGGAILANKAIVDKCYFYENSTRGYNSSGGAMDVSNALISNSVFEGNITTGKGSVGGAISGYTYNCISTTFKSNKTYGVNSKGGAASVGVINATSCLIDSNSTLNKNSSGGAIDTAFGNIAKCVFTNNSTHGDQSAGSAIGIFVYYGNLFISKSEFRNNFNRRDNSTYGYSSLIYTRSPMQIETSLFIDNYDHDANKSDLQKNSEEFIVTEKSLTIRESVFHHNHGGIGVVNTLKSYNCMITNNFGASYATVSNSIQLYNTTVYFNSSSNMSEVGANYLVVQNSIIANNTSLDGNNSDAIRRYYVSIKNSIIGENSDFGLSEARTPDANGNLIGTPENPFDPQLGELTVGANGIPFLPLLPTSPAINLGNSFYATDNNLLFDVRGEQRIIGASVDAGAVEFNGFDFGDAADSYQTLLGSNGPRHLAIGPQLGAGRTIEEDASFSEDEFDDGVQFSELVPGTPASVSVTISNAPQGARLSGWIDFNGNGQFDGSAEAVFQRVLLSGDGTYEMPYQVPFDAQIQETQARFRLSTAGETDWFGQADDGEVEDYLVPIIEPPFVSLSTSAATGQEENQSRISLIATSARPVNGEQQVTVRFSGNAVYGSDYSSDSFVITIPAGEISGSIEIQILEDLRPEPIETIIASVISTTAGLQYDQSATTQVQIEDNDQVSPNGSFSTLTGFSEGKVWISLPYDSGAYASPTLASNLPFSDIQLVKYGDFNGDGFQDIALWRENGEWWVGEASGRGLFFFERWGAWRSGDIGGIRVGDFNGDGKDDLIGLFKVEGATHGNWWAAVSTGTSFENRLWGQYGSFSGIREIVVGNFDGLKGDDLAIVAVSGVVWIAKTSNSSFQYLQSHQWDVQNGINFIQAGDFNGDNRDDLLAVLGNGERRTVSVAKSYGPTKGLISSVWSEWTVRGSLDGVFVGDFDGDGRDNVVGQFNRSKLWFGESDGRAFRMQYWLNWNEISSGWASISVGNSNGDQRVDLIAQTLDGTWRAAESSGSSFAERELVKWDSPRSFLSTNVGYHSQHTSTGEFDVSMVNWDSFSGRWVAPVQSPVQQTAAATPEDLVTVNIPSAAEYEAFAEDQLLESLLGG